jgi:thiol:disulfide interchange protein DsbD
MSMQNLDPVKWTTKIEKHQPHLCVDFDGIIEKDWHVFAVYSDGGPLPLEVIFKTKRKF